MTTLIPIHSAAMFHVVHVRSRMVVGARSRFHRGLPDTSSCSSTKSRRSVVVCALTPVSILRCCPRRSARSLEPELDRDARADLDEPESERALGVGRIAAVERDRVGAGVRDRVAGAGRRLLLDADGLADLLADGAGEG